VKRKIGIDFDDVLFDFNGGMTDFHNKHYGTSYRVTDITLYDYKELWKCDLEESLKRMSEFVKSEYHDLAPTIPGAIEAVNYLNIHYDLPIITARDEALFEKTWGIANKRFPGCFKEIHFLHRNDINVLGSKGEVCRKLGVSIMVEDSLGNAEHLSEAGVVTLLLDKPWNQIQTLPQGVTRVFGWGQVLSKIHEHFAF
jgi:uncharacterized HAD superfamily protein